MRSRQLFILLVASIAVALAFLAPRPALAEPASRVYAGVYLHDVTKFDQKDGVFDVDLELWAKWLGDFDPEKLTIANAAAVERSSSGRKRTGAGTRLGGA